MLFKSIYVKTTGTCNLDCKHCFTGGKNGDRTQFDPVLTGDWIESYMDSFPLGTHYHMELHGGEPFLVPLDKLIAFTDRFYHLDNVSICSNSNLTFKITDEIVSFILKYQNGLIGTSWDHWIRWGNQKQFDLWKSNLYKLVNSGVKINLKVSVSKALIDSSPDWFLDQMDELPISEISLERLTLSGNAEANPDIFPDNELQDNWYLELHKRYIKRIPKYKIVTLDTLVEKLRTNLVKADTNCRNCEQNLLTINSDGTLGGCPNVASEHKHSTLNSAPSVFLSSDGRLNEIAGELDFNVNCITCDVFDLCGGDCHRLPWQGDRCGGLKNTLRFLSGRNTQSNIIFKG